MHYLKTILLTYLFFFSFLSPVKANDTYTIGGMYTYYYQDGRYADWGDYALQSAYMAIEKINASNMLKKKLVMPKELVKDYHCWPENSDKIAHEILSQNVLALTGVDCSGPAELISKEAEKFETAAISYGVNASVFSSPEKYPYFIRVVTPSETYDGYLVALANHLGIKDLVFLHTTDAWGLGAKEIVVKYAKKYNITLVKTISYERATTEEEMNKLLEPVKKAGYKHFIITAPTPDTVTVFKSFGQLGIKNKDTRIFAAEMISADEKEDTMKGCVGYIAPMTQLPKSEQLDQFTADFSQYINKTVDPNSKAFSYAVISHDHIYALAYAIKALEDKNMEVTGKNIMDSLRTVDFKGLTGRVAFTPHTNDRAYMRVTFYNNQGYNEKGQVNFQPVGSYNPEDDSLVFDDKAVKWE